MQTPEEFAKRQAAERAEFEASQAYASAMPLPPHLVVMHGKRAPTVMYKVKTLADAADIFKGLQVVPMVKRKGTFTSVQPDSEFTARERDSSKECGGPFACYIRTSQLHVSGNQVDAELCFYAQTSAGLANVHIKFGAGYIGRCEGLRATITEHRHTRTNKLDSRTYARNANAHALADDCIAWSSGDYGPVKTSGEFSYLFQADQGEAMPGSEHSHALAQLTTLAEQEGV